MSNSTTLIQARSHFAQAHAGVTPLHPITQMAFGRGGADVDDKPIPPDANATELADEIYRKKIESHMFPSATSVTFIATLTYEEANNEQLSEVALVDSAGNIVAIKTFKPKLKDNETEISFEWTEKF